MTGSDSVRWLNTFWAWVALFGLGSTPLLASEAKEQWPQSAEDVSFVSLVPAAFRSALVSYPEGVRLILTEGETDSSGPGAARPILDYEGELILEVRIQGYDTIDILIAYGTPQGVYLPLGALARILDLAVRISDGGKRALGWILQEERPLNIDLRQGLFSVGGEESRIARGFAVAFDGEMYLRAEDLSEFLPLEISTNLRAQSVSIKTLETFPFEERLQREIGRTRLLRRGGGAAEEWPRSHTPWLLASVPSTDVQFRAVSNSARGDRLESDLNFSGDLLFLNSQVFLSGNSSDGLVSSSIRFGRLDPDGELFGPLKATEFSFGDVSSTAMPIGLRSVSGRGFSITNATLEFVSAFDKVDLRGILLDGYEVELYRNDVLVGSTASRTNGRYEFLQVPVDFGMNIFRFVFYGPQGQRYEEVRNISVGDGRLPKGQLVYRFGAVQKDEVLIGLRDPEFLSPRDFGSWRSIAELSYGLSSGVTTVFSAAWFEDEGDEKWTANSGIRTSIGRFSLEADVAATQDGAHALSGGIGGALGQSFFTLSHVEYSGLFLDETRSTSNDFLRRTTELSFNNRFSLGKQGERRLDIPISTRLLRFETLDGLERIAASLQASIWLPRMLLSNSLEYLRTSRTGLETFSQLNGSFDLSTLSQSRTKVRASANYTIQPRLRFVSATLNLDHLVDDLTMVRGSLGYDFSSDAAQISVSGRRQFDRFSLAVYGNYTFVRDSYSFGLRMGLSVGREPIQGRFFLDAENSLANTGSASILAFHDRDGDGRFGEHDEPVPGVTFAAFNSTTKSNDGGVARLTGLRNGRPINIKADEKTLPDIDLAMVSLGVEVVPRAGRIHVVEMPIIALSEVEGTAYLVQEESRRAVSGVRLELQDGDGKSVAATRTELDGYYFFERVQPGTYDIVINIGQVNRLNICLDQDYPVSIGNETEILSVDVKIVPCLPAAGSDSGG